MYQIHLKMILSQVLVMCSYCPNYSGSRRLLEPTVPDQPRQHIEILSQKTKKDLRIFRTMWNIACNIFCSAFKCVCVCVCSGKNIFYKNKNTLEVTQASALAGGVLVCSFPPSVIIKFILV